MRVRRLLPHLAALWCVVVAPANAMPGDAAIVSSSPAPGAALTASGALIQVRYTCPAYRQIDLGDGFAFYGKWSDYGVALASSPATGADGRLSEVLVRDTGHQPTSLPAEQCEGNLGTGRGNGPENTPGTYYWQPYRLCGGCTGGYEAGEVRELTVAVEADLAVRSPGSVYGGYPFALPLQLQGVPDGTEVSIERSSGSTWTQVATAAPSGGAGEAFVTLPAGIARLRIVGQIGTQAISSPELTVKVGKPSARRRPIRAGQWKGDHQVTFTVAKDGKSVRGFTGVVTALCVAVPLPGGQGQTTTSAVAVAFARTKIAPDGRFLITGTQAGTAYVVRGQLRGGRLTGGQIEASEAGCAGTQAFTAKR